MSNVLLQNLNVILLGDLTMREKWLRIVILLTENWTEHVFHIMTSQRYHSLSATSEKTFFFPKWKIFIINYRYKGTATNMLFHWAGEIHCTGKVYPKGGRGLGRWTRSLKTKTIHYTDLFIFQLQNKKFISKVHSSFQMCSTHKC